MKHHLALLLLSLPVFLRAQDANYWSNSYGPGGFVAPGAVIANNRDSGVLSFNPALLAYANKNSASISGNLYQYESINIKNGVGTGLNLTSTNGAVIPEAGAGIFAMHGKHPFVLGYALTRDPVSTYEVTQRRDAHINVLDDSYSPGLENYVGQYSAQNSITETSGLVSVGFRVNKALSAGFSAEGQVRRQVYNTNFSSRALYNVPDSLFPPIASSQETYLVSYTHIGLRFKGGLSYNAGRHHLGLLATLPLIHLYGRATLYADEEINDLMLGGGPFNLLANTRQTGVSTRWKSPFSLGLGYAYDYGDEGQVYVSAEYFTKVGDYNVVTPQNSYFIRPDTGSNNSVTSAVLKFKDAHRALVNVAVGVSFRLREAVLGYCAFRTDLTYADPSLYKDDEGTEANTSYWNNYHLEFGVNVKKRKFNFRPGISLSYGMTNKYMQPYNFDDPHESNFLSGDTHLTKATHFSGGLMLSYIHNL